MAVYLEQFRLASDVEEDWYLALPNKLDFGCYPKSSYPFNFFPKKELETLNFSPITLLYGSNGSGKSTLLNIVAEKLKLSRGAPFNHTPFYEDYLSYCRYTLNERNGLPKGSRIITSDDVFEYLLDVRALNEGVDAARDTLFSEYRRLRENKEDFSFHSFADYGELKERADAARSTRGAFTARRLPQNLRTRSNGESAYSFFVEAITENALYLLDEPENSLSPGLQIELSRFIEDSARFYRCQFIISTHSPFLLSMKEAQIYDMDSLPVTKKRWTELENVLVYKKFFDEHQSEFS